MTKQKQTIWLDFDGVIHSYKSGWQGVTVIPDEPIPYAFAYLKLYLEYFNVAIFSARNHQKGGIEAMKKWFIKHGFQENYIQSDTNKEGIYFPLHKPCAILGLDDNVKRFTGLFPSIDEIKNLESWTKKKG